MHAITEASTHKNINKNQANHCDEDYFDIEEFVTSASHTNIMKLYSVLSIVDVKIFFQIFRIGISVP